MEEEVKIPGKRGPLEGNLHVPEGVEKPPVVVLAHGLFGGKDAPHRLSTARVLQENGFAVLRFNFSAGSFKDKVFDEVLTPQVEDLESALDYLEKRKDLNHNRIGVFAGSMSGAAAFLLAAKDKRIKALVSLASFHNPLDILARYPGMVKRSQAGGELLLPAGRVRFTDKFLLDLHNHNVAEAIKSVKQPVLFLHGDRDRVVPVEHAHKLYADKLGEDKELHIFPARHHGYDKPEDWDIVNGHVLVWFKRWLK